MLFRSSTIPISCLDPAIPKLLIKNVKAHTSSTVSSFQDIPPLLLSRVMALAVPSRVRFFLVISGCENKPNMGKGE